MESSQTYHGYVLRAEPFEIDHLLWTIEGVIERHLEDGRVKRKKYKKPGETCLKKDEAIASFLAFGRQIVDRDIDLPLP